MTKIRILAIPPDIHGVGKFRIISPFTHLQENYPDDFHIDISSNIENTIEAFDNYDIIVAHSFLHNKIGFEENIKKIEWLKSKGKIVIMDTDDYWSPDMRHPLYMQAMLAEIPKKKIELVQSASYVTTTTPIYRDILHTKLKIKNIVVFPNAIDENEPQFIPNPTKSDKIRFGWLGGSSHKYDIELMSDGISMIHDYANGKVQFVLCGFDLKGALRMIDPKTKQITERPFKPEETVWYDYERMFTKNYEILYDDYDYLKHLKSFKEVEYDDLDKPYRRLWTVNISRYAMNYNNFDVSLAPIVNTTFNRYKSQLKVIEAGFHKKALIASECEPYTLDLINATDKGGGLNSNGNSLLVSPQKNHKQWYQHMKKLIDNPSMIEDLGNKLYETMYPKYSLNTVNKARAEFFKSIINK